MKSTHPTIRSIISSALCRWCRTALYGSFAIWLCGSCARSPLTQRLFMQFDGVAIELPEKSYAGDSGAYTLSETVLFRDSVADKPVEPTLEAEKEGIWKAVELNEVNVFAERKRSIEPVVVRNGRITLMFRINVPPSLLDERWQLTLTPQWIEADTAICRLPPVVLRGASFIRKQEEQYKAYTDFLASILPESKYDSAFADRKGIRKDITTWQLRFAGKAEKERRRFMRYRKWRTLMEKRYIDHFRKVDGNQQSLRQRMSYKQLERVYGNMLAGRDTAGLRRAYQARYERHIKRRPVYRSPRAMTLREVPNVFKTYYRANAGLEDIHNHNFTRRDSVEVAANNYFRKAIAVNESKRKFQDRMREHLLTLTLPDSVKEEREAVPGEPFSYLYVHTLPVEEKMRKITLTLKGTVLAIDHSIWHSPPADTLAFVLASVADLADYEGEETDAPTDEYLAGLRALRDRDYPKALTMLDSYADYNTAVALTCSGYHLRAEEILEWLKQTAAVCYLRAIVNVRLNRLETAVDLLLAACEKESKYRFRAKRDVDIQDLISKFRGLRQELERY